MTTEAIEWVKFQQAMTPDKPFFIYYATGATHAPHHAPRRSGSRKYKGKFDDGWLALREKTIVSPEDRWAIIPADTRDSRRCLTISRSGRRSATMRSDCSLCKWKPSPVLPSIRTSKWVGWWSAIDDIGVLENTLFIYVMGDNGSSAEGGLEGTFNELVHLNGIFDAETIESMLKRADDWGGPDSFPTYERVGGPWRQMLRSNGLSRWLRILVELAMGWSCTGLRASRAQR